MFLGADTFVRHCPADSNNNKDIVYAY